jgi:hypothetical protein
MGRRRFDHLVLELSVAAERVVPRYALWLALHDAGLDPELLDADDMTRACDVALTDLVRSCGIRLGARAERRLRNEVRRFDPRVPTPYERLAHLTSA